MRQQLLKPFNSLCKDIQWMKRIMKKITHWDTSAICLCLRLTHRSSSSCSRTSFSRESPMPLVSYLKKKRHWLTDSNLKLMWMCYRKSVLIWSFVCFAFYVLVDVVFDGQQVVAHSLEGQLMQDRRDRVKRPVQDDQLWTSLIWTLQRGRNTGTGIKEAITHCKFTMLNIGSNWNTLSGI